MYTLYYIGTDIFYIGLVSLAFFSGRKIITPKMALEMDVMTLKRTSAALQDLIDTRNSRLIEALEDRNWLRSEIRMKNTFVKMLVERTKQIKHGGTSISNAD